MLLTGKVQLAMLRAEQRSCWQQGSGSDLPMQVRNELGAYVRHFGELSREGCIFKTCLPPKVGRRLEIRLILIGLGIEVRVRGRVTRVTRRESFFVVEVRFDTIPIRVRRAIEAWLKLIAGAHRTSVAA